MISYVKFSMSNFSMIYYLEVNGYINLYFNAILLALWAGWKGLAQPLSDLCVLLCKHVVSSALGLTGFRRTATVEATAWIVWHMVASISLGDSTGIHAQ